MRELYSFNIVLKFRFEIFSKENNFIDILYIGVKTKVNFIKEYKDNINNNKDDAA
nr:hypothetical protein [Clostridium fallax]